jgi:hypothetical protein
MGKLTSRIQPNLPIDMAPRKIEHYLQRQNLPTYLFKHFAELKDQSIYIHHFNPRNNLHRLNQWC